MVSDYQPARYICSCLGCESTCLSNFRLWRRYGSWEEVQRGSSPEAVTWRVSAFNDQYSVISAIVLFLRALLYRCAICPIGANDILLPLPKQAELGRHLRSSIPLFQTNQHLLGGHLSCWVAVAACSTEGEAKH